MTTTVPSGYLKCDGGTYNKSNYTDLFNLLYQLPSATRSTWGSANWTTQFNTPNLQGEFLRGAGTNGHANQGNGANVGIHQNATQQGNLSGLYSSKATAAYAPSTQTDVDNDLYTMDWKTSNDTYGAIVSASGIINTNAWTKNYPHHFTARPTNTSVLICIKY